jgi:hypothetical protein
MGSTINKFLNRLPVKQARVAVICALVLGIVFTSVQIVLDFQEEQLNIDEEVGHLIDTIKSTAAEAAYNIDRVQAESILDGILTFRPIRMGEIKDNFGDVLANTEGVVDSTPPQFWPVWLLEDQQSEIYFDLYVAALNEPVGSLSLLVDCSVALQGFIKRAITSLGTGIIRNIILAGVLVVAFQLLFPALLEDDQNCEAD